MKVILSQSARYWHTIRYLRYIQIFGRLKRFFNRIQIDNSPLEALRLAHGVWVFPARRRQSMISNDLFCFLNETHQITSVDDWNNINFSKLWLYNLHYFDDLSAYDSIERAHWHRNQINEWIEGNPVGNGNGWEPYPSSLRIVNWIKWSLTGNILEEHWIRSLGLQVRYLSQNLEIHLMGNHIFANAKALLFAGCFFEGPEAKLWWKKGYRIIEKELDEQLLNDGGNFELSTMYHMIFLEDLLDIVNLHFVYEKAVPKKLIESINSMFNWLSAMCHPDGEISFFNDAAFGNTPSVLELNDYRDRVYNKHNIRFKYQSTPSRSFIEFPYSGYTRVQMPNMVAIVDRASIGPDYIPGHAHADTLSFELSLFGQRVVVNSGTSVYEQSENRKLQRSTALHSTVVIDNQNSSEVWSAFRVARRARVIECNSKKIKNIIKLSACHDGYKRLSGNQIHCREWVFEDNLLTIIDLIEGQGECKVDSVLPIHPDINIINFKDNEANLEFQGKDILISVEGNGELSVLKSRYHQEFGKSVENLKLVYSARQILPIKLITRIRW